MTGSTVEEVRSYDFQDVRLVVLDHKLPDGTSADVLQVLEPWRSELTVLLVTGWPLSDIPEGVLNKVDGAFPKSSGWLRAFSLLAELRAEGE